MVPNDRGAHFPERHLFEPRRQESVESYAQLYETHHTLVRAQLRKSCHHLADEDLEDLEQEVWMAVWMALPGFEGRSTFPTWLIGVTKNVLYRWLRHRQMNEMALLRLRTWDDGGNETNAACAPGDVLDVGQAINTLSQAEHQAVELRYFERRSDQEIASSLRVPLGTVKGRIRSGLKHLRETLFSIPPAENQPVKNPLAKPEASARRN